MTAQPIQNKISLQGWMGVILSFSLVLSTSGELRVPIGGTLVHLYLFILPLLVIIGGIQLFNIPSRLLIPLLLYTGFFCLPMVLEENLSEVLKIIAGVITILFFIQTIKSDKDIEACSLGFIAAGIYLSIQVVLLSESGKASLLDGVNALSGLGNKNAQSQFMLPAFFFIAFNFYNYVKKRNYYWVAFYSLLSLPIIVGTALSGNRSGYIGMILILIILVISFGLSLRPLILVLLVIFGGFYLIDKYAFPTVSRKIYQTTEGDFNSDQLRQDLIVESVMLGIPNPFPGLGFKGLGTALATEINIPFRSIIDPHNLYGYLLGAGGIFSFIFFFLFFFRSIQMVIRYRKWRKRILRYSAKINDRNIFVWFIGFIFLFLIRSFFTRELIYSPNFMGAAGLLMGCVIFYSRKLRYALST